jgi:hypothetical protein
VKAEDIMALVPILDAAYSDADKRRFHNEALEKLIPVLKGSSKLLTSEAHLVRLCEVWHRTFWTHKSLLGPYAKQGARLFPETLLFDFYLTISETEPGERLHWRQRDRLIKLLEVAQERGESKLASQITQRLMEDDRMVRMAGFPSMPGGGLWDDLEEDLDDEYDQLGLFDPFDDSPEGQGPEALFAALLGKGMPAEIEMILDQISHITGIDDRIELMRILIEKFEEGGDAPALDDLLPGANKKPKPRPKKSKRPKR